MLTFLNKFGKAPDGERLEQIQKSPHFKNGKFENLSKTPQITSETGKFKVFYDFIFKKPPRHKPKDVIPSVKTDLLKLSPDSNVLVWFGHSSCFLQVDGKRILVDPVFSGKASPVMGIRSFKGTDIYSVADMPDIDYLLITHDHYDHLDYRTVRKLKPKTRLVICGLGVGSHMELWGYNKSKILEKDWNETVELEDGFSVHTTPARHFSGRGFSRNNTLWLSFVLITPKRKIFFSGDGGYDSHFADIGRKFGPFDLAILENGQYNMNWRYIHHFPEQVLQTAGDLNARRIFPVHSSKFALGKHPWDEPLVKITEFNKSFNIPLITPKIGELVNLDDEHQKFRQWWTKIN